MRFVAIGIAFLKCAVYSVLALNIPTTLDPRPESSGSDDVATVMTATLNALAGLDALKQIRTFTYHADRSESSSSGARPYFADVDIVYTAATP